MKLCLIWGDMRGDRTDDIYPNDNVCDDCLKTSKKKIIEILDDFDIHFGDECHFCGKSKATEELENG